MALFNLTKVALPKIPVTKNIGPKTLISVTKLTNLSETKKLKDLLDSWGDLVDTSDSDNESQFWFTINIGITVSLGLSGTGNQETFLVCVFLCVGSCSLESKFIFRETFMVFYLDDSTSLNNISLLGILLGKGSLSQSSLVSNSLFLQSFWN